MEIVITQWALNSYLKLIHDGSLSVPDYKNVIRPDVLLLKNFLSNPDPKFQNSKFWSIATDHAKNRVPDGYKMKWHNLGNGKIQLRLPIGMFNEAMLCEAYVKENAKAEQRRIAKFKTHLALIRLGTFTECGRL